MTGKPEQAESKKPTTQHHHDETADALRGDTYKPPLNHRVMNNDGTVQPAKHPDSPKLTDLHIDVDHVKVYDTPKQGANYAERQAAAHREMPISNEHFRDLVKSGMEFMAMNDGGFNLAMKNALEEAHQTDKFAGGGHQNIYQMLKWVNGQLAGTFYTLRRNGDKIQMFDTHESETKAQGTYDLNKRKWD